MDSFEVGGKQYQVVVTHEDGMAELVVLSEGSRVATMLIDERGVSSVIMEQCLIVLRKIKP